MPLSTRTLGILISLALSAGMIAATLVFSGTHGPSIAGAESTEALLRAYARLDTDGDLLMDWQEKLYGSDPENSHSLDSEITDREAVDSGKVKPKFESDTTVLEDLGDEGMLGIQTAPETLTDRFAREFFSNYLTQGGGSVPTEDDLAAFVDREIDVLFRENSAKSAYTTEQLETVPGGEAALRTYAATFERTISEHDVNTSESELIYFADAIHGRSTSGLQTVRLIGEAYSKTAEALTKFPVPVEERSAHVRLINAFSRMGIIVKNMATFDKDPLLAFVSVSSYETAIKELALSFAGL